MRCTLPAIFVCSHVIEVFNTGLAIWSWRFKADDSIFFAESALAFDSEGAARLNAMEVLGQMASAVVEMEPASGA